MLISVLEHGNEELNRPIDVLGIVFKKEVFSFNPAQIAPLAKPVAHHLLGRVVRSCESSPAGPGTQCRRQVHVRMQGRS